MNFYLLRHDNSNSKWKKTKTYYELVQDIRVIFSDRENNIYDLKLKKGFRTDGLTIPKPFTWFLDRWDDRNAVYNLAGIVHDALYCIAGRNERGRNLTREQCDDVFRGILRDSGISRFKAGVADKCIEYFAKSHFDSDEYDNYHFIIFR